MLHVEKKLEELGIELPPAPTPKANYNIVCHASGNMLYISGHLPLKADGTLMVGRIGQQPDGETVEHGYEAARHAGLNLISTMKEQLGDLDRVEQVVKVREGTMQN
jgi:enamine deaminase RidA (YjgF/YER057c/UK114 family)